MRLQFGVCAAILCTPLVALAQEEGAGAQAAPGAPVAPESGATPEPAAQTGTTVYVPQGLPAPGTNLEGHLGSSSQARADINQGDRFDLQGARQASPTLRGNPGALGISVDEVQGNSGVYVVRKGDTLSRISERAYGQPWMWPKLWSFNPQIQNPHWIYPGDQVRLTGTIGLKPAQSVRTLGAGGFTGLAKLVPPKTVFLRRWGYIDDPSKGVVGEVVGAKAPVQLLAEGDQIYLVLKPQQRVNKGQVLSIFRAVREPPRVRKARTPPGQLVALQGSAQVEYINPKTRIARARITESIDVIERGAKVGFVPREFSVVPPRRAKNNVSARVITSMYPHVFMAKHQVLFIDRGEKDGLAVGNRLFVIRRGDTWRRTLATSSMMARSRIKMNVPESLDIEAVPLRGNEQDFPEEVVGELRVVDLQPFSALVVVTESSVAIVPGDRAVARSGF